MHCMSLSMRGYCKGGHLTLSKNSKMLEASEVLAEMRHVKQAVWKMAKIFY